MEIIFSKTRTDLQRERLRFALFVAVAFHAMIIFGIGFNALKSKSQHQTIEVTLAHQPSELIPEQAEFIAQANQMASGTSNKDDKPTTDVFTESNAAEINEQNQAMAARVSELERKIITSAEQGKHLPDQLSPEQVENPDSANQQQQSRKQTLQSLQAELDKRRNQYNKMPRTKRLTSVSTKSSDEAAYLNYWVKRAELIGNQNYPEEARRKGIYGELQLAVTMNPNGSIDNIEIVKSSGYRVLDLAAVRTVRQAAPFAPFNASMQSFDKYEIIRTWRYLPDDSLTTENHQ